MMKALPVLLALAFLSLVHATPAPAQEVKKSTLPGKATWDVKAFNKLFRVSSTEHDARRNRITWSLRTKEGMRTFELVRLLDRDRPFTFLFYDEDKAELARVALRASDFKGIPKGKLTNANTRLEVTIDLPKAMPRVKKVVLKSGPVD